MSEAGPLLSSRRLWAERENKCLRILDRAMVLLTLEANLPESEVELNRCLYLCLLTATRELYPNDDIAPLAECNNQPDPDDETRAARELKRPDFQWVFLDRYESNPHRSSKQFVVECKRIGRPRRPDWVFNVNYVNHGICRFRDPNWAYAQRFSSGAMIGYWQSMDGPEVISDIHQESRKHSLPDLVLVGAWNAGSVTRLHHSFERPFQVSPFGLHHLWIDIRPVTHSS